MKKVRKIWAKILALTMILVMVSNVGHTSIRAEDGSSQDYYRKPDGSIVSLSNATELVDGVTSLGTAGEESWYIVKASTVTTDERVVVNGSVNIVLADDCTWNAKMGINVSKAEEENGYNALTIWAQSEGDGAGCLNATVSKNVRSEGIAAIGAEGHYFGGDTRTLIVNGDITINGGNVNASGWSGPGIGAGNSMGEPNAKAQNITINGGHVVSKGNDGGPGIGAGGILNFAQRTCSCENIVINGGIVEAYGSAYAAGIGTGFSQRGSYAKGITINGGMITAVGGDYAAGIGAGTAYGSSTIYNSRAEDITINGGTIYAVGGTEGQGVGSYYGIPASKTDNRTITGTDSSGVYNFKVTGGNLYLEGMDGASSSVLEQYENSDLLPLMQAVRPTNTNGQELNMVEIQVNGCESAVTLDSSINTNGKEIVSNKDKKIYLWLPKQDFLMPEVGNIYLEKGYYYSVAGNTVKRAAYTGNSNFILSKDFTLDDCQTLRVDSNAVLKIKSGKTLTAKGQIEINGRLENNGTLILSGGYYTELKDFNGKLIIQGGSYEVDPSQYVSDDYEVTRSGSLYKVVKKAHKHSGQLQEGKSASCTVDGWKSYYKCSCGMYFADENCTEEINDLYAWITGAGKISATGHKTELKDMKASTHFEKGYTGDTVCIYCHKTIARGEAIDVLKLEAVAFSKVKSIKAKTIKLSWTKGQEASGYIIQYSTDKNFKKGLKKHQVKNNSTVSYSLKKLSSKKKYYVRIRAYKTGTVSGKNVTVYSNWSKAIGVKVK